MTAKQIENKTAQTSAQTAPEQWIHVRPWHWPSTGCDYSTRLRRGGFYTIRCDTQ